MHFWCSSRRGAPDPNLGAGPPPRGTLWKEMGGTIEVKKVAFLSNGTCYDARLSYCLINYVEFIGDVLHGIGGYGTTA